MSSTNSSATPMLERLETFVSENKRVLLAAAATTLVVGGLAAYYVASSSPSTPPPPGSSSAKRNKKKGPSKKKGKDATLEDGEGPILEEIKTPAKKDWEKRDARTLDAAKAAHKNLEELANPDADYSLDLIETLTTEERQTLAAILKTKGNSAYGQRRFRPAAQFYTRAIEVTPKPEPVFFSNRAACYLNFEKPDYEKAVADCDSALELDKNYLKALNRRAGALENLKRYVEALRDYTAVSIIEGFKNEGAANGVERVIKELVVPKAADMIKNRELKLPGHTFVDAYFGAFRRRDRPALPATPTTGDNTFYLALDALDAKDFTHSLTLVNEALEQGMSEDWPEGKAEALNLRGSFRFLTGDTPSARKDIQDSIDLVPKFTQSWVKIASVHMEMGDVNKAFECFDEAEKVCSNGKDSDVFYHRGQVFFIMQEYEKAAQSYEKAIELDPNFVFSQIQLAVAHYKAKDIERSLTAFKEAMKKFPDRSEVWNYYGELLLDQGNMSEAIDNFDKAIEIEKKAKPQPNTLSIINKALALFTSQADINVANKLVHEALQIDPDSEPAIATLAQLNLQQGKHKEAAELFRRQATLARVEADLANTLGFLYATEAQITFLENYPEHAQLFPTARG